MTLDQVLLFVCCCRYWGVIVWRVCVCVCVCVYGLRDGHEQRFFCPVMYIMIQI
jgi:hypothetical protein